MIFWEATVKIRGKITEQLFLPQNRPKKPNYGMNHTTLPIPMNINFMNCTQDVSLRKLSKFPHLTWADHAKTFREELSYKVWNLLFIYTSKF